MTDPLQLPLRDIHLPAHISWWPPAPAWWILTGLIILSVMLSWWWYRRRQKQRLSAIYLAGMELRHLRRQFAQEHDARQLVRDLSVLLRRVSISAFPRTETASLTGMAWLEHLDMPLQDSPFSSGPGRLLVSAPYQNDVPLEQVEPLFELCESWIDAVARNNRG